MTSTKKPIGVIVLGPYRSGTSVTAQVLHALGIDFGPKRHMVPATKHNPGGHFERRDINDANDALIRSIGKDLGEPGDPVELSTKGDKRTFEMADMSWRESGRPWGIKDPRLCATLLAWIEAGYLDRDVLKIVHIRRNLDASTRSALAYESVRRFCDGTEAGVRHMLERCQELAMWHVDTLGIPTLTLDYEELVKSPQATIERLAEFVGVSDPRRIRRAVNLIGKGKGMFTLQLERYFIRGPRRLFRLLTGQGWHPNR